MHKKLKGLRKFNDLSQEDVAKLLGLSTHSYSNKENGKTPFTLNEAKKISDLFNLTVDSIFFNDEVPEMRTRTTA